MKKCDRAALVVPAGEFQVSIDDLRRQAAEGRLTAGPRGVQQKGSGLAGATQVPDGKFHQMSN